jgi:lipoprotein-releasing system permease protein
VVFEFQFIKRYLIPSKRNLSSSLISNISIFTIALTVWLLIVFLSVLKGVENSWIQKLTTLQGPIRIVPNARYFSSDYFLSSSTTDLLVASSETLFEKYENATLDEKDLVGQVVQTLRQKKLKFDIYEVSAAILHVHLNRFEDQRLHESTITQATYLTNPMENSLNFQKILLPLDETDIKGLKKLNSNSLSAAQIINNQLVFPKPIGHLEPVLLPKNFKDSSCVAGDKIELQPQQALSLMGSQPKIYGYICGFYDPGLMSVGTRLAFLRKEVISQLTCPELAPSLDPLLKGGFFVYTPHLKEVKSLVKDLKKQEAMKYFDVIPYYDFPFAKEIMSQFHADQVLFSLIGFVILIIACLNIIAALILIVQEKKEEIGLLVALGASKGQIQRIFGLLGFFIGLMGFLMGTVFAVITLDRLEWIVSKLLFLQGHPVIKVLSFDTNSSLISFEALSYVMIITPLLALIAGLIPAKKALKIEPIEILKNG